MRLSTLLSGAALGLTMVLASAATSNAAVVGVSSAAALHADDSIDWGQLGPVATWVNPGTSATSAGGLVATLNTAGTGFQRIDQGSGWNGNFSNGEHLLWTSGQGPDITINFDHPVYGAGAQIQANFFGAFVAEIFGSNGSLLGSFTENGSSNANGDGSAIFIGLKSALKEITQIQFVLPSAYYAPNDFSIGSLQISSCVPEPSTWGMMLVGFLGVGFAVRRRARRAAAAAAAAA